MSCCGPCLKIQVLDNYSAVPDHFLTDGKLYLDVGEDFSLEFAKTLSEVTELNQINEEGVLSVSLPYTDKNKFISDFVRNHNRTINNYSPLQVLVQEGPITHRLTELLLLNSSDESKTIEAEFRRGPGHWLTAARELYLRQVDLGTFELNEANLRNNWENNASYTNGGNAYYFPLCYYGAWASLEDVKPADFRPWFHLLGLLQKGFCSTGQGWTFRSPWLESTKGRKIGAYLAGVDYGQEEQYLEERKISASIDYEAASLADFQPYTNTEGVVIFPIIGSNPNGYYNENTGYYTAANAVVDVTVRLETIQFTARGNEPIRVEIVMRRASGDLEVIRTEEQISPAVENPLLSWDITEREIYIPAGASLGIYIFHADVISLPRKIAGFFQVTPRRVSYQTGDTINLSQGIKEDLTLLDFFKGVAQLVNGKIHTDWQTREVWLYTPYEREYYDETIEGFYTNEIEDWTDVIVGDSEAVSIEKQGLQRYALLRFAEAQDAAIREDKLELDSPLYSRLIDYGAETGNEDTSEIKNPIFQPTINRDVTKFAAIAPQTEFYNLSIPWLVDNLEGKLSFDIGPRLAEFAGYVSTRKTDVPFSPLRRWIFEGTTENRLPFAFQELPPDTDIQIGLLPQPKEGGPVFADHVNDFYNIGWKEELSARFESVRASFQVRLPALAYKALSFRHWAKIYYNGRTFYARLLEVSGRKACNEEPFLAVFRPDKYSPECSSIRIIPTIVKCSDAPGITVNVDVPNNTITADVNNDFVDAPIITDGLQLSTDQGQTWQGYVAQTPVANETLVTFRRQTDLESCGPVETVRPVDFRNFCQNSFTIDVVQNTRANTVSATATDSFNSLVDSETWEVAVDLGARAPYTPGDTISPFTTVEFFRTVSFTNNCPDVSVSKIVEAANETGSICSNAIDIGFTEVAPCVFLPELTGSYNSTICSTVWEVTKDNGSSWAAWDFAPVKSEAGTKVRSAIYFCDYCPPIYLEKACPFNE